MELLIEHNSFHCMDKCLRKKAKDRRDVDDFLQICIQAIFADTLYLSNYIPTSAKEISLEEINRMEKKGLCNIKFANDKDRNLWNEVCGKTSNYLLEEINRIVLSKSKKDFCNNLPELSPELGKVISAITKAIQSGNEDMFHDILKRISEEERNDALIEILSNKGDLFDKILGFKKQWNERLTFKLINDSRCFQNGIIANSQKLLYSPSVKRIRDEELFYNRMFSQFNEMLKRYGHERLSGIELPSISEYLKMKSRGQPDRLLDEVLILREKSTHIRCFINKNKPKLFNGNRNLRIDAMSQLNELSKEIFCISSKASTQKVIGVQHDASSFSDLSVLSNAIESKRYSPQYRCFTEIAYALGEADAFNIRYNKILEENCISKY